MEWSRWSCLLFSGLTLAVLLVTGMLYRQAEQTPAHLITPDPRSRPLRYDDDFDHDKVKDLGLLAGEHVKLIKFLYTWFGPATVFNDSIIMQESFYPGEIAVLSTICDGEDSYNIEKIAETTVRLLHASEKMSIHEAVKMWTVIGRVMHAFLPVNIIDCINLCERCIELALYYQTRSLVIDYASLKRKLSLLETRL